LIQNIQAIQNYVPTTTQKIAYAKADAQPFMPQELELSPFDQRSFSYYKFKIWSKYLTLGTIDQILWTQNQGGNNYISTYFKIIKTTNWEQRSGFVEYECVEDFQNTPNFPGETMEDLVGVGICDIISNWFFVQGIPLYAGQIFLYNSNYTPQPVKGFLIVVQLTNVEAWDVGSESEPTENPDGTVSSTITQSLRETYTIQVISADSSATIASGITQLALNPEKDYANKKQTEIGFRMANTTECENISGTTGGSTVTRWMIKVVCQTQRTQSQPPIGRVEIVDWSLTLKTQ
jgi:hypothetical protein